MPLVLLWALALAVGCGGSGEPPAELREDVVALRQLIHSDPAQGPIAEADRVADDRPVLGARLVAAGALPAARRQVTAAEQLVLTTDPGRAFARRLATAYAERVRGLEAWHAFLADQGTDMEALLEATSTMRRAEVAVLSVDRELDLIVPLAPRPTEPGSEPEGEPEPARDERLPPGAAR